MHTIYIQLKLWNPQHGPMMLSRVHPQNIMPNLFTTLISSILWPTIFIIFSVKKWLFSQNFFKMHTIFIQLKIRNLQHGLMMLNRVHPQNMMPNLFTMEISWVVWPTIFTIISIENVVPSPNIKKIGLRSTLGWEALTSCVKVRRLFSSLSREMLTFSRLNEHNQLKTFPHIFSL